MRTALELFVRSWPEGVRPKIHFSSPRTEMREIKRKVTDKDREILASGKPLKGVKEDLKPTSRLKTVMLPPVWTGHADFTNPFEFATFMHMAPDLDFDVMLESKTKDLSLLKLKADLLRYAPDVAVRFGTGPDDAREADAVEDMLDEGVGADEDPDVDEGTLAAE
jgi:UV DNA damage endonuclease